MLIFIWNSTVSLCVPEGFKSFTVLCWPVSYYATTCDECVHRARFAQNVAAHAHEHLGDKTMRHATTHYRRTGQVSNSVKENGDSHWELISFSFMFPERFKSFTGLCLPVSGTMLDFPMRGHGWWMSAPVSICKEFCCASLWTLWRRHYEACNNTLLHKTSSIQFCKGKYWFPFGIQHFCHFVFPEGF